MSSVLNKLESARAHVQVQWSDERCRAAMNAMVSTRQRRARTRATLGVVASLLLLVAFGFALQRAFGRPTTAVARPADSAGSGVIRLDDGSVVTALNPGASVRQVQSSPTLVVLQVVTGAARFDVTPNPSRVLRVEAGRVSVQVLGTSFTVEKFDSNAKVSVHRGRVRVSWDDRSTQLGAGEQGVFPPQPAAAEGSCSSPVASADPPASVEPPATVSRAASSVAPRAAASAGSGWRAFAQEGDFDKAYEALQREGTDTVGDAPADLLLAADVARLSHHSGQAVAPLRRLLQGHPGDPRAPLAAFTLGRVLLDELGRPREAAQAFAQARALAPGGAMAQDALAREVEAWSRAGDSSTARARAEEYLKQFPNGRRERSVRRYGGVE
jgi:transmembrane sensor